MVARWEAGTKKPAPRGAGPFVFPLKNRSAEQRPHPDTRVDPAFVDHLDRDIDDHGEADVGDPAGALDILGDDVRRERSEEHTSELQSLMRISYAVFCLKTKK